VRRVGLVLAFAEGRSGPLLCKWCWMWASLGGSWGWGLSFVLFCAVFFFIDDKRWNGWLAL
jgi:hypothetical protein